MKGSYTAGLRAVTRVLAGVWMSSLGSLLWKHKLKQLRKGKAMGPSRTTERHLRVKMSIFQSGSFGRAWKQKVNSFGMLFLFKRPAICHSVSFTFQRVEEYKENRL